MIRLSSLPGRRTLLTIVNYGFFQNRPDTNKDTNRTQTRTRAGHKQGQNKEEPKEGPKEGKKEASLSEGEEEDLTAWEELEDDAAT
jgi:hypothetical protein